jgi:hypothetical protein
VDVVSGVCWKIVTSFKSSPGIYPRLDEGDLRMSLESSDCNKSAGVWLMA